MSDMAPTPGGAAPEPSATAWLARLEAGEVSSRELTERTLRRIEAANGELNAVTAIYPERSLAAADEADRERAAGRSGANPDRARSGGSGSGAGSGGAGRPLLGLPVTIKDTVDVEGWPTTAGVGQPSTSTVSLIVTGSPRRGRSAPPMPAARSRSASSAIASDRSG